MTKSMTQQEKFREIWNSPGVIFPLHIVQWTENKLGPGSELYLIGYATRGRIVNPPPKKRKKVARG